MAGAGGLEPPYGFLRIHEVNSFASYQVRVHPKKMAGGEGVEPSYFVLETNVIPLYDPPIENVMSLHQSSLHGLF